MSLLCFPPSHLAWLMTAHLDWKVWEGRKRLFFLNPVYKNDSQVFSSARAHTQVNAWTGGAAGSWKQHNKTKLFIYFIWNFLKHPMLSSLTRTCLKRSFDFNIPTLPKNTLLKLQSSVCWYIWYCLVCRRTQQNLWCTSQKQPMTKCFVCLKAAEEERFSTICNCRS